MQILALRSWQVRLSSVALALSVGAALPVAAVHAGVPIGDRAQPPSITLPPLPDVTVRIGNAGADSAASHPAATPAPAASDPAAVPAPAATGAASPPAAPLPVLNAALKDALEALGKANLPRGAAGVALRKERKAIADFYTERNFAPLWLADGAWTAAAKSALAQLKRAGEDGLDIPASSLPTLGNGDPAALASTELTLSEAVVNYGRQASGGRINPLAISRFITERPAPAEPARILSTVASAADAGAVLEDFNPPQAGYKALRQKLVELRAERTPMAAPRVRSRPILKVGMNDPRVPLIRPRFGLDAEPGTEPSDPVYDSVVATAAEQFQISSERPVSRRLTRRKVATISRDRQLRLESEILANMELWRWLPRDLGIDRIEVNIPDFSLALVHDDAVVHSARVIVGKPDTPTPVFSSAVQYIDVNPYWNVPPSIVRKEMLPHLAQDPYYFQRMGYEVTMRHGQLRVRQPPGAHNALGRIKFIFPNDQAIYLHDTPQKSLFSAGRRAFSHGCVRVDQPLQLAELVLGKDSSWTPARLEKLIGGPNRAIRLPKALPIHIEYFTAWVDAHGKLQLRNDIYGYSHKIELALGLKD